MDTRKRWQLLVKRLGVDDHQHQQRVFCELMVRYQEDGRAFHTIPLIELGFLDLHAFREVCEDCEDTVNPNYLELAWWCRFSAYDPRSLFDPSAAYAQFLARELGLSKEKACYVSELIQEARSDTPTSITARYLQDLGNRFLAESPLRLRGYWEQFALEHRHLSMLECHKRWRAKLEPLFARDSIFCTPFFVRRYEERARVTIEHALALSSSP